MRDLSPHAIQTRNARDVTLAKTSADRTSLVARIQPEWATYVKLPGQLLE
jgi:hypothetical protein